MLHHIRPFIVSLFITLLLLLGLTSLPRSHSAWQSEHLLVKSETKEVTSASDSGPGTLRQALLDAEHGDTITFDPAIFPPTSPVTIALQSELPAITTDGLTLDASHAGVVLDGGNLSRGNGLTINGANNVTIRGLQIINFPDDGIKLTRGASHAIIGGDRSIGAAPLGQGNLLSNQSNVSSAGIQLTGVGTNSNQVQGNYIGTDLTGKGKLGNYNGIVVDAGASDNIIGGDTLATGNLISGNQLTGVRLDGLATTGNIVRGNKIGIDVTCTFALGNQDGIDIYRATGNIIGGERPQDRNVVSGNTQNGIRLTGNGTTDNQVLGNYIGTDCDGSQAIGNEIGVRLTFGAAHNVIGGPSAEARNLISGNDKEGVLISGQATTKNQIIGNYIGTDVTGTMSLGDGADGVGIARGASQNTVGGTTSQERNLISGNGGWGILIANTNSTDNRILGNYIGTDATGSSALGNERGGVGIGLGAQDNIVGGTHGAHNIISGNAWQGINIQGDRTTGNQVLENYIGTDATGSIPLGNLGAGIEIKAVNNVISGTLISGNHAQGILLGGTDNQIFGNVIGTDKSGERPIPNHIGVETNDTAIGATGNLISGTLIAFNRSAAVIAKGGVSNVFQRNLIQHNGGVAAQLTLGNKLIDNDFFANEFNIVQVSDGTLTEDEIWTAQGDLHTYLVVKDPLIFGDDLVIASGRTLTVAPGVNVQFDFGLEAEIEGALVAEGTAEQPIHFTSAQRFGNPLPGEWKGLTFAAGGTGSLSHTSIEFAENGLTLLNGASVEVISSTIAANEKHGIFVPAETLTFTLTLDNNAIAGNGQLAINNQSAIPISAPNSWWGSASGPNHADDPSGQGDAVSANVNIESWRRDSGAKDAWSTALVANLGRHHFTIDDNRSLHWYRIPMERGATLTATLSHPQQDYDLFLFSNLEEPATLLDDLGEAEDVTRATKDIRREAKDILGNDTKGIGDGAGICSSGYIAQVANLGQANRGRLLRASCGAPIWEEEVVSTDVWDQSGWYYLSVAGHNGANNNTISYTLEITLTEGTTGVGVDVQVPLFDPPESSQPGKKSIILTNEARLKERYQPNEVNTLMNKLDQLATHPQVSGVVIDLGTYNKFDEVYESWDEHITDTTSANYVAASVKALLTSLRGAYPDLENILIVGNDEIIPFRRIPDEVTIANERDYSPPSIPPNSGGEAALMSNLRAGYFLSDDYYAGFDPIPYRGRGLFLPEYAMGRLVETPSEMMTAIDTFLETPVLTVTSGLVTGYDFLVDQAEAIVQELEQGGLTPDTLISHSWQADNLKEAWLNRRHDLSSINAHFQHDIALPAERAGGDVSAADVQASDNLTGSVVFSVGCHSGLPVSGSDEGQLDFAQVLVGRGAMYVANTGYGYGDANAIGYSEHLMRLFVRHLREGATVGQALAQAKREYFNTMGIEAVTPYDEKVLAVATFYGFPMYQVRMPNAPEPERTSARQAPSGQLGPLTTCPEGLTCREAIFTPIYITETVTDGTYFSVQGETEERLGQPILPRTSIEIFETQITNTLEITAARGVLFEGAKYRTFPNFNPVITRIITDSIDYIEREPLYSVKAWAPGERERISSLRTGDKITQRLVVIPAQYRSTNPWIGIARRFSHITDTIYYSSASDTILPSIWQVATTRQGQSPQVKVEVDVTDFSGVVRTVATYTTGYGTWQSVDLEQVGNSNIWQGYLPYHPTLDYLVQAVDGAGNVAVHDNKGRYFPPAAPASSIYLPIIRR